MHPEYKAIEPEKLAEVQARDVETDKLYDLRRRRADLSKSLWRYLPKHNPESEESLRIRPEKLLESKKAGIPTHDLINWKYFERQAEKEGWDQDQREIQAAEIEQGLDMVLNLTEQIHDLENASETAVGHFKFREREMAQDEKALEGFEQDIAKQERLLDKMVSKPGIKDAKKLVAIRGCREKIQKLKKERHEFLESHTEAYYLERHNEIVAIKETFDKTGKIVETPYVKEKLDFILSNLNRHTPVFIHGELGTGKTELAVHLSRTRLSQPHLRRWEEEHPMPDAGDKEALAVWAAERERQSQPITVHGHRGMEAEAMTAELGIAPGKAPSAEEQSKLIEKGWQSFKADLIAKAGDDGEEVGSERLEKLEKDYRAAKLESFKRPIETRRILRGLLLAMQEGRPVIIDEMNAVPHHVLIVLNDYLMRKPGDQITPPFPEISPFKVQEGFCVMATGNYKPEDGELYAGRQQVDAAFLSRFALIHYDYLPQQENLEPAGLSSDEQRKWRRGNELLMMMTARLLDKHLELNLPEGALRQMEKLAKTARGIQDVFSGAEVNQAWWAQDGTAKVKPQDILKENVLSLRHLLRILDRWHAEGYQYPVEFYVFEDYVARSTERPKEMKYLYDMLRIMGDFFTDSRIWPDSPTIAQLQTLSPTAIKARYDALIESGDMSLPSIESMSERQVIEKMFGPAPERTVISAESQVDERPKQEAESMEEALEREEALQILRQAVEQAERINQNHGEDYHV